jgi:hypothetical protein
MRSAVLAQVVSPDEATLQNTLARSIYDTDNLTMFVRRIAGMGELTNELRQRGLRPPTNPERQRLLLPQGLKNVLVRKGITCTAIQTAEPPLVMVSFVAVVVRFRLPEDVREELEHGSMGLGEALQPHHVRRHITGVHFTNGVDRLGGERFLRVKATLSLPDVGPVALVNEVLYTSALR